MGKGGGGVAVLRCCEHPRKKTSPVGHSPTVHLGQWAGGCAMGGKGVAGHAKGRGVQGGGDPPSGAEFLKGAGGGGVEGNQMWAMQRGWAWGTKHNCTRG